MELVVRGSPVGETPLWKHFLLKDVKVTVRALPGNVAETLTRVADAYRWSAPAGQNAVELTIEVPFTYKGKTYQLLKVVQRFNIAPDVTSSTPTATVWQKGPPRLQSLSKVSPALHPLLTLSGTTIALNIKFLDITGLFNDIHGNTPWFAALGLLKTTNRHIRTLASLTGQPLLWHVVVPDAVVAEKALQPILAIYAADYGGYHYDQNSIAGVAAVAHNTSVGAIQCGGEMLLQYLTQPLSDKNYQSLLPKYLALVEQFKRRPGNKLRPLHHYRNVMGFTPSGGKLNPEYWDIPFGFERALSNRKHIMIIPQLDGGVGGLAIQKDLKALITNLLMNLYTQSNLLVSDTVSIGQLILTCYSEAGGNVFTAADNNPGDIKALVCFEPQYMNANDSGNSQLKLGKNVIPKLLKQNGKVALIGRWRELGAKYLPSGVSVSDLTILPEAAFYDLLKYPPSNVKGSPVLTRRYARLIDSQHDVVIEMLLEGEQILDFESSEKESKVEEIVGRLRAQKLSDDAILSTVFRAEFMPDQPGGYFQHNFIIAAGQELLPDGETVKTFFETALERIG